MINDNMVSWFISMMNIHMLNSIIMFVNDSSLLIMGVINVMINGLCDPVQQTPRQQIHWRGHRQRTRDPS